ncbi:hypothetical protein BaRGS_00017529 [Batillaria attramentaria]|uniref:Uncharacterized protein n=1 Tax=Batillaria attramentaria TaxID=370345 RepID=A0ABD0KVF6_9CAEN
MKCEGREEPIEVASRDCSTHAHSRRHEKGYCGSKLPKLVFRISALPRLCSSVIRKRASEQVVGAMFGVGVGRPGGAKTCRKSLCGFRRTLGFVLSSGRKET